MPEVVLAVIKELRESGEVEKLICSHFEHNEQSKRVIEKCGFHFVKESSVLARTGEEHVTYNYVLDNPDRAK